jgi:hypothetical protein
VVETFRVTVKSSLTALIVTDTIKHMDTGKLCLALKYHRKTVQSKLKRAILPT